MPRSKEQFEEIRNKTKLKILESALELFSERGFKGTSISEIAKAANISKGLAYNYFKNKNELMISVFGILTKQMEGIFISVRSQKKPQEKLKLFINETLKLVKEEEKFWRLYMNFILSPEVQKEAEKYLGQFLESAMTEIEYIFEEMGMPNSATESRIFGAIIDGMCFHYFMDKENYPLEKMRRFLINKYCK